MYSAIICTATGSTIYLAYTVSIHIMLTNITSRYVYISYNRKIHTENGHYYYINITSQ